MFNKVTIIGTGLIGGSIGLDIKRRKIAKKVIGVVKCNNSLKISKKIGAIDFGTNSVEEGVANSDLIIIATPVEITLEKIEEVFKFAKTKAIIIDVTSVKEPIVKHADKLLRKRKDISFVGTHPMAGSEEFGTSSAKIGLFDNSVCIITPTAKTDKVALCAVKKFWENLGAWVKMMSVKEHDAIVSKISHLPHLISFALCNITTKDEAKLAGGSFMDLTRIAKSNPRMWTEIIHINKKNILKSIELLEKNIASLKNCIKKSKSDLLFKKLSNGRDKKLSFK